MTKKILKKKFWIFVIILVLGIGAYFIFGKKSNVKSVTAKVERGTVKEEMVLTGQVEADKHVKLFFPTSGKLSWVGVGEGQKVYKGQALTSLDKTNLNTTYQQALNNYRNYQAAAESALDSVKDHSSNETFAQKATRTAAEVARDNAFDSVTAAEYNLRNATLFAPFAGIVTSLPFQNPGVNVNFTDLQVEIVDPQSIYFKIEADQSEVISIKTNMSVDIVLDSFRDKIITGIVSFVSFTPKTGEVSTIYEVKVTLDKNSLGDLQPRIGMSGDARFIISKKEDALFVASRFINSDKNGKYVNLGKMNNKVKVETGIENEDNIEIISGVKEGDVLYD